MGREKRGEIITFHYPLLTKIRSLYCVILNIHYQSQKGVRGIEHRFFVSGVSGVEQEKANPIPSDNLPNPPQSKEWKDYSWNYICDLHRLQNQNTEASKLISACLWDRNDTVCSDRGIILPFQKPVRTDLELSLIELILGSLISPCMISACHWIARISLSQWERSHSEIQALSVLSTLQALPKRFPSVIWCEGITDSQVRPGG